MTLGAGGSAGSATQAAAPAYHIDADEWVYRVEGGQHLVFEYAGRQPALLNTILRLRSVKRINSPRPTTDPQYPLCDESAAERALFQTSLCPFLIHGDRHQLDPETAFALGERALLFRPTKRTLMNTVPLRPAAALIQSDLTRRFGDDTLCVEVKPKSFNISRSRLCRPADCALLHKFSRCDAHIRLFGRHRFAAAARGEPLYDPADLLSGDAGRVNRALHALRVDRSRWLRVLAGGQFLAATEFIANRGASTIMAYDHPCCVRALHVAAAALARHPACSAALRRMQALDYLDREGAELIWNRLVALCGADAAGRMVWACYIRTALPAAAGDIADPSSFQEWRARVAYPDPRTAQAQHDQHRYAAALRDVDTMPAPVCARMIADFMAAAAARDCSLLIAMAPVGSSGFCAAQWRGEIVEDVEGTEWGVAVNVIDIGPKTLSKIKKWADEDRRLAQVTYNIVCEEEAEGM